MNWFIITSTKCNLLCRYCMNEPHTDLPIEPDWKIKDLKEFLSSDDSPTIAFYGGEPILNLQLIKEIIDEIPAVHYTIQTNGLLLNNIPGNYLTKFSSILVSLDGDKEITDLNRGKGIYDRVANNIKDIKARGFEGDLIARMAVSEDSDIFKDVIHLLNDSVLSFNNVHWQIDCQWDEGMNVRWEDFSGWIDSYNQGITKLVEYWLEEMKKGKVKGIVPFLGIFRHILNKTKTGLPCEAGLTSFAIRTDSKITFCPLPPEYEETVIGDIHNSTPKDLENSVKVKNPCPDCEVFDLCGGRCLFANLYKLWGEEGFKLVCRTVKHLVNELQNIENEVMELIQKGVIKKEDFDYPAYNNTTEIIP
ncbi:MAG: TIGR04084 family radical SAM/SPASM domain-containing protein [Candidatus Heimdallarchaeota archaeon]|nr:TIGR04084 family radical SAM/SPASM domain-containing protein [Candidatus Heimdallarchaeota archaeon]MCK4878543.1 TIGR04084 family radical SAM/SPASM domain-containing protein [Candidatus Heimdallarchaeota archaeon]